MTATPPPSGSSEAMVEWLEAEVSGLRQQLSRQSEQAQIDHTQLWDLAERFQKAESGTANVTNQIDALVGLDREVRALRERLDRLQALFAQEQEQVSHLGRQLRAEMQSDRDDRTQLARRTEFAERTVGSLSDRLAAVDEAVRRGQDDLHAVSQRFDSVEVDVVALDSRVSANAEAQRRVQGNAETLTDKIQEMEDLASQFNERLTILEEQVRRITDDALGVGEMRHEFDTLRERVEAIRIASDATTERSNSVARDYGVLNGQLEEVERSLERQRVKAEQQDHALAELRRLVHEVRNLTARESERFIGFQEKLRRRQIADLEQEVREIKGYARPEGAPEPDV